MSAGCCLLRVCVVYDVLLRAVWCALSVASCVLFVVRCGMFAVCVVRRLLFVIGCVLLPVKCSMVVGDCCVACNVMLIVVCCGEFGVARCSLLVVLVFVFGVCIVLLIGDAFLFC